MQATGLAERANRKLQDRLVKELRMPGISNMEAGKRFLSRFVERFIERSAIVAAKPENLHCALWLTTSRLSDMLCQREQRFVGAQLHFHDDGK